MLYLKYKKFHIKIYSLRYIDFLCIQIHTIKRVVPYQIAVLNQLHNAHTIHIIVPYVYLYNFALIVIAYICIYLKQSPTQIGMSSHFAQYYRILLFLHTTHTR